jgi:hypothetical protein
MDHLRKLLSTETAGFDTDLFFRVLPMYDEIVVPSSLFIFHSINALYFVFKERPSKPLLPLKSILKTRKGYETAVRKTKKSL